MQQELTETQSSENWQQLYSRLLEQTKGLSFVEAFSLFTVENTKIHHNQATFEKINTLMKAELRKIVTIKLRKYGHYDPSLLAELIDDSIQSTLIRLISENVHIKQNLLSAFDSYVEAVIIDGRRKTEAQKRGQGKWEDDIDADGLDERLYSEALNVEITLSPAQLVEHINNRCSTLSQRLIALILFLNWSADQPIYYAKLEAAMAELLQEWLLHAEQLSKESLKLRYVQTVPTEKSQHTVNSINTNTESNIVRHYFRALEEKGIVIEYSNKSNSLTVLISRTKDTIKSDAELLRCQMELQQCSNEEIYTAVLEVQQALRREKSAAQHQRRQKKTVKRRYPTNTIPKHILAAAYSAVEKEDTQQPSLPADSSAVAKQSEVQPPAKLDQEQPRPVIIPEEKQPVFSPKQTVPDDELRRASMLVPRTDGKRRKRVRTPEELLELRKKILEEVGPIAVSNDARGQQVLAEIRAGIESGDKRQRRGKHNSLTAEQRAILQSERRKALRNKYRLGSRELRDPSLLDNQSGAIELRQKVENIFSGKTESNE